MIFVKSCLRWLGIAYFIVGLLMVGIRFVKRNGVVGSLMNPYASSDTTLGDVILWPLLLMRDAEKPAETSPIRTTR